MTSRLPPEAISRRDRTTMIFYLAERLRAGKLRPGFLEATLASIPSGGRESYIHLVERPYPRARFVSESDPWSIPPRYGGDTLSH